jgi:hypothetical protein
MGQEELAAARGTPKLNPLAPKSPHFAPKDKRVIYRFMGGAPSQLDLFDYKPGRAKYDGKPVPQRGAPADRGRPGDRDAHQLL